MIILRLNEEERLFAVSRSSQLNSLFDVMESTAMEVIKLVEFKKICGDDGMVDHWLNITSSNLANKVDSTTIRFHMGFLGALNNEDIDSLIKNIDLVRNKYKTPVDFIKAVKKRLRNETKKGDYKYRDWLKENDKITHNDNKFLVSNEDYVNLFKFITLSLSGDIEPSDYNYWDIFSNEIQNMPISRKPKTNLRNQMLSKYIKDILKECIEMMSKNITYPVVAQSQNPNKKK